MTDLTSDTPRVIMRLCGLTDSVVQVLSTRPYVNRKGLRSSAGQGWYGQYLKVYGFGCQVVTSAPFWAERGLSPLWFRVSSADWKFQEGIRPLLASVVPNAAWLFEDRTTGWQGYWVPLRVAEGRERDAVVRDLITQVEAISAQLAAHAQAELEVPPIAP